MKKDKFIYNLCETFLRNDCDPSKSQLTKNQKVTSLIHKEEDNSLVIFDKSFPKNSANKKEAFGPILNLRSCTNDVIHSGIWLSYIFLVSKKT